jgi:hypothetical protein
VIVKNPIISGHPIRRIALLTCLGVVACTTGPEISYQRDVRPILVSRCIDCHSRPDGEGYRKTGLDLETYESLKRGSLYGPVVVPGKSRRSPLNMLVEGRAGDLSRILKKQHDPMRNHEIEILRLWVDQGARNN